MTPDRLLQRLEWRVVRRLDGRLQGAFRTAQRGTGLDLAGIRPYAAGDDARAIDWNATARLDEPQVRQFVAERDLTSWLVLDRSASMQVGAPGRGKHDVLVELALALTRLLGRSGNRVGAVVYGGDRAHVVPPRTGRSQALRVAAALARQASSRRETTDLAAMVDAAASVARRRALVVVVSDFIGEGDWQRALLRLAHRHEVVALRIVDEADDALPDVGLVVVEDAETGEQLLVDTSDPLVRAGLVSAVGARDGEIDAGMRRARVPVHRIDTRADLVAALVDVVTATQRRVP
ncbi:DUF58 domain-containing protein [Nocardioides sp.]|uniref:DUF58 domain-containing protein n=1 Tax=Nocardioides sp. TaxID=35761 RepID=UPI0039E216D7